MERKRKLSAKPNKPITARLLEISLKIDGFVYMHKPLPATDAAMYLEEIATYKPLCSKDERSLQVIEKLTRCMKSIITEQQDSGNSNHDINSCRTKTVENYTQSNCSSPVYSLPDEDRALMTNTFDVDTIDDTVTANAREIETIDLCLDDEVDDTNLKNTFAFDVDVEIEMHRPLSNMSIVDDLVAATPVACSQSNLLNYRQNNRADGLKNTETVAKHKSLESKKSYGIPNMATKENSLSATNVKGSKNILLTLEPNNNLIYVYKHTATGSKDRGTEINGKPDILRSATKFCQANKTKNSTALKGMEMKNTVCFDSNNVVMNTKENKNKATPKRLTNKNKDQRKITTRKGRTASKKHCDCEITEITNQPKKIASKKNTSKKTKTVVESIGTVAAASKTGNRTVTAGNETKTPKNATKCYMRKNVKPTVEIHKKPMTINYQLSNPTNCIENEPVVIYNKSVDDDLSWLDNIRYVRQVAAEEHDPKLNDLEDSFWDNYTLPSFWNEQDFV